MTFTTTGAGPVLPSLPAWTTVAYEISNFARWVTGFAATGDGHSLTWDKVDYDTRRVRSAGAKSLRVTFRYVSGSLDNAMAVAVGVGRHHRLLRRSGRGPCRRGQ